MFKNTWFKRIILFVVVFRVLFELVIYYDVPFIVEAFAAFGCFFALVSCIYCLCMLVHEATRQGMAFSTIWIWIRRQKNEKN